MKAVRVTQANCLTDWIAGDAGDIRMLTDQQAYEAVTVHKIAVYAPEHDPVPAAPPVPVTPEPVTVMEFPGTVVDQDALEAGYPVDVDPEELGLYDDGSYPGGTPYPGAEPAVPGAEMKRPYGNASKAAWIDWAVHQGAEAAEAAGMTKNELMNRYGEAL